MPVLKQKNEFNKLCSAIKKCPSFKEGVQVRMSQDIMLSDKVEVEMNTWYMIKGGKVYTIVERDTVYVVWDPEFHFSKNQFHSYSYSNQGLTDDPITSVLFDLFQKDNYYMRFEQEKLETILQDDLSGYTPEDISNMTGIVADKVFHGTKLYHKLKDFYDSAMTSMPRYLLQDEVHKKLTNRNVIPVMFWNEQRDELSYANERYYGNSPMATKYRVTEPLEVVVRSRDLIKKCNRAVAFTPVKEWGKLLYKNAVSGQEREAYIGR